jgi:hypothetical protein
MKRYGWIQVGRDEAAAKAHPEWLHTPQHDEWLKEPGERDKTKGESKAVWPWVCVNNRAVFDYELARVERIVAEAPGLDGLFLCDIQGPPNGCGCGNLLCRSWDNSAGPKVAPSAYERPDTYFSQIFVEAVRKRFPRLEVIPIVCGECENGLDVGRAVNPDAKSGACNGIPCLHPCSLDYYPGLLRSLAGPRPIGLLTLYKTLKRDRPEYGGEAAWIGASVERVHQYAPDQRVLTVLEGWNATEAQRRAQIAQARAGGASGYVMALSAVDQSWSAKPVQPVLFGLPSGEAAATFHSSETGHDPLHRSLSER